MRPAVGDDVVHGRGAARARPRPGAAGVRAQQRARAPDRTAAPPRPRPAARAALARLRGQRAQVDHAAGRPEPAGSITCTGSPSTTGKRGAQHLVPAHDLVQRCAPAPRRPARRAAAARAACCRRRSPARAGRGTRAAAARTRAAAGASRAGPRQGGRGGLPRRSLRSRLYAHGAAGPRSAQSNRARSGSSTPNAWRARVARSRVAQQRVAAQREEVVLHPHALDAEHLRPDAAEDLLGRRARHGVRLGRGRRASGAGSARRSTLPLALSGSASSRTNERRAPCSSGSRRFQVRRAAPATDSRVSGRDDVGHQPRLARRVRRAPRRPRPRRPDARAARLDLARLDAEAADLDLVVGPAQELQRAVRAAGGPGRRCGRARSPGAAANGSGTKRSAVRSGRPR